MAGHGPAVIIVDHNDQVSQMSLGAECRLAEMVSGTQAADAVSTVWSLVAAADGWCSTLHRWLGAAARPATWS